jgi:hypothetical protein
MRLVFAYIVMMGGERTPLGPANSYWPQAALTLLRFRR